MDIKDLLGIGETSQGLAKLGETIKGFFIFSREFKRAEKLIDKVKESSLNPESISLETTTLKIEIKGMQHPEQTKCIERVIQSKSNQFSKEQLNTDRVVAEAIDNLKDANNISPEPVDDEWLANFFEHTKFATSEYVQKLWGKILADEVKQPDSYSIRALNTLRILRKKEAETFAKLCNLVLSNINQDYHLIIDNLEYLYKEYGIINKDLNYLEELGLINHLGISHYAGGIIYSKAENKAVFTYGRKKVFTYMTNNIIHSLMDMSFYSLTFLGRELAQLVTPVYHENYLNIIYKHFNKKPINKESQYEFSIADILQIEEEDGGIALKPSNFVDIEVALGIAP